MSVRTRRTKHRAISLGYLLAVALSALTSGCVTPAPDVNKYFSRGGDDPKSAATYIRYAVEAKQYEAAYDSLSEETQNEVSYSRFRFLLSFIDVPESEVTVREFIVDGSPTLDRRSLTEKRGVVIMFYNGEETAIQAPLTFIRSDNSAEWRLDLEQTLLEWNVQL